MVLERHKFNLRKRLLYLLTGKIYVAGGVIPTRQPIEPPPVVNKLESLASQVARRKETTYLFTPGDYPCKHQNYTYRNYYNPFCLDCKQYFKEK